MFSLPPRICPPTPTSGTRAPATNFPDALRYSYTFDQRFPGPMETSFLSRLSFRAFNWFKSTSNPSWPILAQVGFGLWPPLRTANLGCVNVMIFRNRPTSYAVLGVMIHRALSQHRSDLTNSLRGQEKRFMKSCSHAQASRKNAVAATTCLRILRS